MNFIEHLHSYLSEKEIADLMNSLDNESKHGVLLNTSKMTDQTFLSLYPNALKHPIVPHAYIYNKKEYDLGKNVYHTLGCFYLQEPSAMLPAYLLNAQKDELILDMCAAPGGKTIQTSFLLDNSGLIISNDISRQRCSAIVENIERLGLGNVIITNNDLSLIANKYSNTFDRIILDAPCSGSGMFRKEDKMKDDWSYNKVLKFAETQKELILLAFDMLKPGGTICYSTCSFSQEEDEDVVEYLINNRPIELIQIEDNKLFYINKKKPLGIHLFPHLFPGEGHYICLLKKPGNSVIKRQKDIVSDKKYGLKFQNIYHFSNFLFGLNYDFNYRYFNVVRLGVKVGELIGQEIRYDYHYSHYVKDMQNYNLNDDTLKFYFNGETISANIAKGYYLLKYKGINVDIAKADGRVIKNHFPKAFRHKI